MNRRGFFASLLCAAVGPPAAAAVAIRKPAQPGFVGVPYRVWLDNDAMFERYIRPAAQACALHFERETLREYNFYFTAQAESLKIGETVMIRPPRRRNRRYLQFDPARLPA